MSNNARGYNAPKSSPITKGRDSKKKSFRKRASDAPTWDDVSPQLVHALVSACCTCNAPPTFGYTRDGTSLTLAVYYDGERYVDYLSGPDEVAAYFDWLLDELLGLSTEEALRFRQAKL